jgi:hypothetical protein
MSNISIFNKAGQCRNTGRMIPSETNIINITLALTIKVVFED